MSGKFSKILIGLALTTFITAMPVMASNPTYNYTVQNTGRKYTKVTTQVNNKIHAGEAWTNNVLSIHFTDPNALTSATLGMAYIPLTTSLYQAGDPGWRKTTGITYHSWGSYPGSVGQYHLGARIDDLLTGSGSASGRWNSDSTL